MMLNKRKNKICTVSTVKAPKEQLIQWVNYHLNIGIDHMFLFFDDPNDPAMEEIKKYPKSSVTYFKCDEKHWGRYSKKKKIPIEVKQRINSKIALGASIKKDYDWISHIDSDELIYIKKNLKNIYIINN